MTTISLKKYIDSKPAMTINDWLTTIENLLSSSQKLVVIREATKSGKVIHSMELAK